MQGELTLTIADESPVRAGWLVLAIGALLALGAAAVWMFAPRAGPLGLTVDLPPSPPPTVEPMELQTIDPEAAKQINATVPFVTGALPAAKPFRISGSPTDIARATDCLASAIYYEAGNEALTGQKAVAQVILNRARHPAFPATVCGVVYQGATRRTGCQFSFSCDGSMARRRPSAEMWTQLRGVASLMLHGEVYAPVGLATHYHTDWVLPYWSAKLDKIRAEASHLFFRWTGWWGTPTAFRQRYAGGEPLVNRLAALSPSHANALAGEVALDAGAPLPGADQTAPTIPASLQQVFASPAGNFLIFAANRNASPGGLAEAAAAACGANAYCKVMVWTDRVNMPTTLPVSDEQRTHMAFSYLRDTGTGLDKPLWNCRVFQRADPAQCMRDTAPVAAAPAKSAKAGSPAPVAAKPAKSAPDDDVLIPIAPEKPAAEDPTAMLKPSTESFGGRRRPGDPR